MTKIHSTAVIADTVELGRDVCIGPYCCVDGNVVLGDNCHLDTHVVVTGNTTIGADTRIFPFASIGHISQDLKYDGEDVSLEIGARNTIREHVTINPGTDQGGGVTRVGDDNLFMVGVHVAHDCIVGNNVIMANNATLGGHVTVADYAILGGLVGVHQFVGVAGGLQEGAACTQATQPAQRTAAWGKRAGVGRAGVGGLRPTRGRRAQRDTRDGEGVRGGSCRGAGTQPGQWHARGALTGVLRDSRRGTVRNIDGAEGDGAAAAARGT